MAMGGGGSTYKSADGIWHAAIDIEPDRATGRRRRLTALCLALVVEDTLVSEDMKCSVGIWNSTA